MENRPLYQLDPKSANLAGKVGLLRLRAQRANDLLADSLSTLTYLHQCVSEECAVCALKLRIRRHLREEPGV